METKTNDSNYDHGLMSVWSIAKGWHTVPAFLPLNASLSEISEWMRANGWTNSWIYGLAEGREFSIPLYKKCVEGKWEFLLEYNLLHVPDFDSLEEFLRLHHPVVVAVEEYGKLAYVLRGEQEENLQ